ncbi:hypothetical protein BGW36DRAFT_428872 [Talaromyces proteolyticus]|uniref:Uncharacterized protein n=1 Tax=Talaromyces proteolyticus TaxID=1131652 RepID=A0AAD4PWD6_9EURO|nr:uncharacterized protein BGW36DRAFT_428872 [Talaromyces proteolyticus]KAH8694975.1 hypothetical protein BGW36DRAFT_428872 [Talaromyces proteolyticus]
MNWTGGRLRRQSHNKPNSILRIQKQHFAKARLKQREAQIKAARSRCDLHADDSGKSRCSHTSNWDKRQVANQTEKTSRYHPLYAPFDTALESSSTSYVDNFKQHLLQKHDWVGLSPTQPAQVKFASIEEKERIGRRRKLSEDEEARITVMAKRTAFRRSRLDSIEDQFGARMNANPESNINIQINTAEVPLRAYENPKFSRGSNSSDSMLLDVEDTRDTWPFSIFAQHHVEATQRGVFSENELPHTAKRNDLNGTKGGRCEPMMDMSMKSQTQHSTSSMPILHRFTLDDQVLDEGGEHSGSDLNHPIRSKDQIRNSSFPRCNFYHKRGNSERDDEETILSFPTTMRLDDTFPKDTESCGSHPTDSDTLPQTQKIARQLPPSQPRPINQPIFATPFRTTRQDYEGHVQDSEPTIDVTSSTHQVSEPPHFFGQSMPLVQGLQNAEPSGFISPQPERPFAPNIHIRHLGQISANNKTREEENVTESLNKPGKFRVPSYWTLPRNDRQLLDADEMTTHLKIPTSPFVAPLPRKSSGFGVLERHTYASQSSNAERYATSIFHNPGAYERSEMPPYFNMPFRRYVQ